jgi:ADP-dependent phosphofructokinase/glucokinase
MPTASWRARYVELAQKLPTFGGRCGLALCGLNTCVDAVVALREAGPLFEPDVPPAAAAFAAELRYRVARGVGGEIRVEWPEGSSWLEERLRPRTAMGGTGAHAARLLTLLGGRALLALTDRSSHQLALVDPRLLLAEDGRSVPAGAVIPRGEGRPNIYIFEYTAGQRVADIVPGRSSRIIVRFNDPGLDHDLDFEAVSTALAAEAGSGVLSGFNAVASDELAAEVRWGRQLGLAWAAAGVPMLHLELAGYQSAADRDSVIRGLQGCYSSIGMSHSEFLALGRPTEDLGLAMIGLGRVLGVRRVCVHADQWAASATLDDPGHELDALMAGCLIASARAAAGGPVWPDAAASAASFAEAPFGDASRRGAWWLVSCAAPYLTSPATTLGLGDTFMAGCLLVLGARGLDGIRSEEAGADRLRR